MPPPPRTTKRLVVSGCHANPARGPKLSSGGGVRIRKSSLLRATPAGSGPRKFPGTTYPARVAVAGEFPGMGWLLTRAGQTPLHPPSAALAYPEYSHRRPRFRVRRDLAFPSSRMNEI